MNSESGFRQALTAFIREQAQPADKFGHQPRLYRLTQLVGKGQHYDDDVVFAAAWMHDLGVFYGHRPKDSDELARWDNVKYACEKTPGVLRSIGFPEEKIPAVVAAIRVHQPSAVPKTLEGSILRDADILEQLGAVAVLRAVAKVGRDTRFATFSDVMPVLRKALGELPGQLTLESARELARERISALEAFIRSVDEECGDLLF
jgi:uncharacterized protein